MYSFRALLHMLNMVSPLLWVETITGRHLIEQLLNVARHLDMCLTRTCRTRTASNMFSAVRHADSFGVTWCNLSVLC